MKCFSASFETIILRYYLMMAVIGVSFIIGMPYLAILAVPIFLSAMMGVKLERPARKKRIAMESKYNGNIEQAA